MNHVTSERRYGLRRGAEEFPLMVVLSIVYPCNLGCPMCPYTDANSQIRSYYREHGGDLFPVPLWNRIADECGAHGAWLRCTGGGEPMLHPKMVEMVEHAKGRGARVWLNTNGSMFGPTPAGRRRLERLIVAGIDLIEFSMDAADPDTYARLRPPRRGAPRDKAAWFADHVDGIREALALRRRHRVATRVVVSLIRQKAIEGRLEDAVRFYADQVGVDEVITRKFLTWDDNTRIPVGQALDAQLYEAAPAVRHEPCVWPFERLNVDTLGRIALCGQDISFRTAALFPNANDASIKEIWQGDAFTWYRRKHLEGRGATCAPCRDCSAWRAGIRDWDHGWLRVLKASGDRLQEAMRRDRESGGTPCPPDPGAAP
jgi:MoaA/NifB/PqqE/SkfB family radical SAM enzyme